MLQGCLHCWSVCGEGSCLLAARPCQAVHGVRAGKDWLTTSAALHNLLWGVLAQMVMPLALLGALHLDRITDLAWSTDGQLLAVSSYDGFCR